MSRFRRLRSFSLAFPLLLAPLAAAAQAPHYGYSPHFCQTWSHPASENVENDDTVLGAVTAVSASNLWAVGNSFDGTARHTLAENWNGAVWTIVPTPDGAQPNSLLTAVDSRGPNVWAGGEYTDRVMRLDPKTGAITEYLLPRFTNIRRVFVDSLTTPSTFWVGNNHGASIVKLEPQD